MRNWVRIVLENGNLTIQANVTNNDVIALLETAKAQVMKAVLPDAPHPIAPSAEEGGSASTGKTSGFAVRQVA